MDAAERELFAGAVRRAMEAGPGDALEGALAELGWRDALATDAAAAVPVLFEAQGAVNATSSALDGVVAAALGLADRGPAALVLPPLRRDAAPAHRDGTRWVVRGVGGVALPRAGSAVVVAVGDAGHNAFAVETAALELRPVSGIDPALGLVEVTGALDPLGAEALGPVEWQDGVAAGRLAVGHELVGMMRAMLELARRHALERVQFGRPIGSFQAVRHRLAESLVAVEASAALLGAAGDEPTPATAALAKGMAGRSARTVARHAQQVLAGIGFTTEHPLHAYVRRVVVLDQLLGAGTLLTRQSGADVLRTGRLPATFPL